MVQVGKKYKTIGGWEALVIHINNSNNFFYAIHAPNTPNESVPILHQPNGMSVSQFSIAEPPRFNKTLPSDILINEVIA